jgi:myo-inositol-1(or 4)-monophosphatase
MNDPLEFAVNLVLETGELLQNFYNPAGILSSLKPDKTVVTAADLAADELITRKIKANFPQDAVVSEESSHFLLDNQSPTWVIDPLDGTTNYSLGLPIWGISIARLINGQPDLGVVFFPRLNELYTARRASGAYLNQSSISTRAPDPAQPMSFFACCSRTFRNFDINIPYKPRIMGSSAYSFCMVARGSALLGFDATPKIWDLSAVWLLVEEAGGIIQSFDNTQVYPLNISLDYSTASFPVLAAATLAVFEKSRSKIIRKATNQHI